MTYLVFLYLGKIRYFGIQAITAMAGADSWVVFHLCNSYGDCCTTRKVTDTIANRYKFVGLKNSPGPCSNILLDSQDPGEGSQSIEIEHFGPVGLQAEWAHFNVDGKFILSCTDPQGPKGKIILPGGARARIKLSCKTEFVSAWY